MGKSITVAVVGGGSGGHITPLVSVAKQLKKQDSTVRIVHIGHKGDPLNNVTISSASIDETKTVMAGKYRRYNGQSAISKLFDVKTQFFNIRDFFKFCIGVVQSWFLLGRVKPDVILMKGGYVCVGVGVAARLRSVPYITHDSDSMVSLAHQVIAKAAKLHLTALPASYYAKYDAQKVQQVGVPIDQEKFNDELSQNDIKSFKKKKNIPLDKKIILVTGGGNGAHNVNSAAVRESTWLVSQGFFIVHICGAKLEDKVKKEYAKQELTVQSNVLVEGFTDTMYEFTSAADVIVTRAGMTALTEFAALKKTCVVVPNPLLSGGHQLKNADWLLKKAAVIVADEANIIANLREKIEQAIAETSQGRDLGVALHTALPSDASSKIATLLLGKSKAN